MEELPIIHANTNGQDASTEEIIEVRILTLRKAEEINSQYKGREFIIQEIILGVGKMRKEVPYTTQFLSYGYECKAVIISPGKIRIL